MAPRPNQPFNWMEHTGTAACAALLTMVIAYFTGAAEWVRRPEMTTTIDTKIATSKELTTQELSVIRQSVVEIKAEQRENARIVTEQLNNLQQQVTRLSTKAEQALVPMSTTNSDG